MQFLVAFVVLLLRDTCNGEHEPEQPDPPDEKTAPVRWHGLRLASNANDAEESADDSEVRDVFSDIHPTRLTAPGVWMVSLNFYGTLMEVNLCGWQGNERSRKWQRTKTCLRKAHRAQ